MRIYFLRHGESQANLLREISNRGLRHGLTPRGREQAVALAQRLQIHAITRIYSSPMLRAIETSVVLAHRLGVDYEISDALREYDCGILEGRADDDAWQGWQELFDAWTVQRRWEQRIEGGESFNDVRARFEPFIEGLVACYGNSEFPSLSGSSDESQSDLIAIVAQKGVTDLRADFRLSLLLKATESAKIRTIYRQGAMPLPTRRNRCLSNCPGCSTAMQRAG